jgi:plasmid replication initiation protein
MIKSTTIRQNYQLVNAKYKLDTTEIKFIMVALTQIKKEDKEFCNYEINIKELQNTLGAEQNSTRLKQFAKKLMSKPLEVPTGRGGWIIFNWFSKIHYVPDEQKFIVRFDEDLKPYLLDLRERYVSHNLKYILPLASNYSVRIYQLLKEYEKLTKRYFNVTELMDVLQVPPSLKIYNRFKEKVLKVAELEILEHTDIAFTFEEEKAGKKVDRLIFRIYPNPNLAKKQKDNNVLFDAKVEHKYEKYYGKNVKVNDKIHEHILIITPISDDSLIVKFRDNSEVRFMTEKALSDNLI